MVVALAQLLAGLLLMVSGIFMFWTVPVLGPVDVAVGALLFFTSIYKDNTPTGTV